MRPSIGMHKDKAGDWIALAVGLEGCESHGETENKALENVKDAAAGWLEAASEAGEAIPPEWVGFDPVITDELVVVKLGHRELTPDEIAYGLTLVDEVREFHQL